MDAVEMCINDSFYFSFPASYLNLTFQFHRYSCRWQNICQAFYNNVFNDRDSQDTEWEPARSITAIEASIAAFSAAPVSATCSPGSKGTALETPLIET